MKILIIDDETIVRLGMRHVIPWEDYGYEVVGEASNGIEALKLARLHKPDIILTDIVMPEMDGLDFIAEIKKELPYTKFIIFSCHDDIEFYRKAIKLEVCEYIQKSSVSSEEILQAVNTVSEKIRLENAKRYNFNQKAAVVNVGIKKAELLNFIVNEKLTQAQDIYEVFDSLKIDFSENFGHIIKFKADYVEINDKKNKDDTKYKLGKTEKERKERKDENENENEEIQGYKEYKEYNGEYDLSIVNVSQNIIDNDSMVDGYIFIKDSGVFVGLILLKSEISVKEEYDKEEYLKNIFFRINENIKQIFGLILTFGIGNIINDYLKVNESYQNAVEALGNSFGHGLGEIYFYSDIVSTANIDEVLLLINEENAKIHKYTPLIENEKILESLLRIENLLRQNYGISEKYLKSIYMDILYYIINKLRNDCIDITDIMGKYFNPVEYIENSKELNNLNNKINYILENIKQYYSDKIRGKEKLIIMQINNYICENINKHITLEEIAEVVHFNPSYMSRFYKRETGKNIQEYIISKKIEKSKELIVSGLSASQINEKIGFSSESHFFKVFKRYTDMTPNQYKKLIKQKL